MSSVTSGPINCYPLKQRMRSFLQNARKSHQIFDIADKIYFVIPLGFQQAKNILLRDF